MEQKWKKIKRHIKRNWNKLINEMNWNDKLNEIEIE